MRKFIFAAALALALIATPTAHAGLSVAVPEPSSFLMLGSGLFALGGLLIGIRRKK